MATRALDSATLAFGLVLLNGFFVATEFAIVKVRPTRIEELARKNTVGAHAVRGMLRNLDGNLSAIQLGITIASLGLGWLGEPAFANLLTDRTLMSSNPWLDIGLLIAWGILLGISCLLRPGSLLGDANHRRCSAGHLGRSNPG